MLLQLQVAYLRGLVPHPASQHSALHVLAEVQQPGQQLVLGDRAARQHDTVGPAHLVVQREGLHALKTLAG